LLNQIIWLTHELNLDNDYLKFLITWSKERIFTLKELLNEEFIYLWKVPDFKWKVSDIATHEEFESVLNSMIDLLESLEENEVNSKDIYQVIRKLYNEKHSNLIGFKKFMKILRLCLTNLEKGSPIGETLELLGPQRAKTYLKSAYNYVNNNLQQKHFN